MVGITNVSGVVLPGTGGPGTRLFCLIGCILMVCVGVEIVMEHIKWGVIGANTLEFANKTTLVRGVMGNKREV